MAADVAEVLAGFRAYAEPRDGLSDNPFRLACSLAAPATEEEISSAWPTPPPAELVRAWSVSRESRLFEDLDYGQWGLVLLSPAASAARTAQHRALRPAEYRPDDVIAGEFLGDSDLLVVAPSEVGERKLLVAVPLEGRDVWYAVGPDLARFLERYLDRYGDKYWEPPGRSE